jgi:hypothetical protein
VNILKMAVISANFLDHSLGFVVELSYIKEMKDTGKVFPVNLL